jgi:hypothetical protein
LGRSQSTFSNYARHVAAISLYFGKIPTGLDPEQVQDYLYFLQKKSKTPSQTYFKHPVYGLRFLLKTEGLPYEFLHLPSIKHEKKPFQRKCSCCKTGKLITLLLFDKRGPPELYFGDRQKTNPCKK